MTEELIERSTEKLMALRDLIIQRANAQRREILEQAQKEAAAWQQQEAERLERETELIIQEARTRSEEIRRRQVLSAEREKATQLLKLQNRLLSEAQGQLLDALVRLRERPDYPSILAGLALEAASALPEGQPLLLRLAGVDAPYGEEVVKLATAARPGLKLRFDPTPAPILGGCQVLTEDGRRQVDVDWNTKAHELMDTLAKRLLPLL